MGLCKITDGLLGICMIALSLLLAAIIRQRWRSSRRGSKLPLGSLGLPLLGETLEFVSCAYSPRPESFMDKRRVRYGKVFKSHIFGSPTIVSTDPEVTKFVLQSDARTFVPSYPRSLMELIGKSSILLINGGLQRRLHGLIGSFLKSPHLKAQITRDMQRYVDAMMGGWNDGQLVYVQDETKQVLVRALMSVEPGGDMQFLKQQFEVFIAGLMSLPVKMPGSRLYRSLQAKKKMVRMIQGIVEEKRRMREEESPSPSPSPSPPPPAAAAGSCAPPRDVMDALLGDNSGQLTDELISDNMIDLMIPGEDSVPLLMTLAVKYLSDCPLALRQLEEENTELMRRKSQSGELCWVDYVSLPFTQNVITETLRLGNINYGTMRKAMKDVEIKGYLIPKGWCVFTYFRSVHLDEALYKDPYEFNPWRWQEKDMGTCHYFTPFGGGQRLCPGLDLARLEASIFLHHLLANFTWVAEKDSVVNFPTVRMKGRMPIRVNRKGGREEERAGRAAHH
ncbi:hypothetical protein Taro_035991 [Colocasia esculenta]|uniref:Cytochrome P450 90D2 n=1 Tax=Colocasia esculenta TaxID=4460 RepID=A0A843W1W7_COLES|nr:hypothetical protein [Colocasia esculenta]